MKLVSTSGLLDLIWNGARKKMGKDFSVIALAQRDQISHSACSQ
jgi:hypothetical protein